MYSIYSRCLIWSIYLYDFLLYPPVAYILAPYDFIYELFMLFYFFYQFWESGTCYTFSPKAFNYIYFTYFVCVSGSGQVGSTALLLCHWVCVCGGGTENKFCELSPLTPYRSCT